MKFKVMILSIVVFSVVHTFANELCYKTSNYKPISVSLRHDDSSENQYTVTVTDGSVEYSAWYTPTTISDSQLELTKTVDLSSNESFLPQSLSLSLVIQGFDTYKVLAGERIFENNSVSFSEKDCGPDVASPRHPWPGDASGGCPNSPRNHCI